MTDNDIIYTVYCRKCGFKLYPESIFCSKCGTKVIGTVKGNELRQNVPPRSSAQTTKVSPTLRSEPQKEEETLQKSAEPFGTSISESIDTYSDFMNKYRK